MMRSTLCAAVGLSMAAFVSMAEAQTTNSAQTTTATPVPTTTTGTSNAASFGQSGPATMKKLLAEGYEIKTGFVDPSGGAYLALQKSTSAYFCHSNPNPTCEKLN